MIWNPWEPLYVVGGLVAVAVTGIIAKTVVVCKKLNLERDRMRYQNEMVHRTLDETEKQP